MQLEQTPPKKPSFLKVVLLSAGAILLIFVVVVAVIGLDGKHLTHFPYRHAQQTSDASSR